MGDVSEKIEGRFDIIVGRAILHHLNYRDVLGKLYDNNLNPGGRMIFMEPFGSNLISRIFYFIAKNAHTPDERPFFKEDIRWMQRKFKNMEMIPINYLSVPIGLLSSYTMPYADNFMMRGCDRIDCWIARNAKFLSYRFRQGIFVIEKSNTAP